MSKGVSKIWILLITVVILIGGFLAWQKWQTRAFVKSSAVWSCTSEECLKKWRDCNNLDCILSVMQSQGASQDAINFARFISKDMPNSSGWGYLKQFQEIGKVDLGTLFFPNRANFNAEYYLLNGIPPAVRAAAIPEQEEDKINNAVKQDPVFSEIKAKYPNADWEYTSARFIERKILSNGNERFTFSFQFVNGCRICSTEYLLTIGLDFSPSGKLLNRNFIQIIKDETANLQTYRNADLGIEFKYPQKFTTAFSLPEQSVVALTDKSNSAPRLSTLPDIFVKVLNVLPGENFQDVLIKDVIFDGSGENPKSFAELSQKKLGGNTVYFIKSGLFEGILSMNYYLVKDDRIVAFYLHSSPVDWTNPDFKPENDPLNQELQEIISTFKFL